MNLRGAGLSWTLADNCLLLFPLFSTCPFRDAVLFLHILLSRHGHARPTDTDIWCHAPHALVAKTQTLALSLSSQTHRGGESMGHSHTHALQDTTTQRAFPRKRDTDTTSVTQTLQVQVSRRHHHNKCDTLNTTAVSTHGHTPGQTHHQDTVTLSLDNTQSTTLISMTSVFVPSLQLASQHKVTCFKYSQPMQTLVITCNHHAWLQVRCLQNVMVMETFTFDCLEHVLAQCCKWHLLGYARRNEILVMVMPSTRTFKLRLSIIDFKKKLVVCFFKHILAVNFCLLWHKN